MVSFKNKNDIDFTKLIDLYILNLSFNKLSEINDVNYFENLKELYINNNKIEDISFCEKLPNLLILNAENNNIINITSLNICSKLKTLKLSSNNIRYLNSTLRTIKNLKKLEDFSIKQNPFLSELFSYREYFISNYPNIKIFDGEILDKEKKIFAETFYKENNPLYNTSTNRPMTSTGRGGDRNNKLKNKSNNNDLFGEDNGDEEDMEDDDEDIFNVNNNNSNDIFKLDDNINIKKKKKCC
jgi:Leucine-rich repeat (LRR) protein